MTPKVRAVRRIVATAIGVTAVALAAHFVHSSRTVQEGWPVKPTTPKRDAIWYSGYAEGLRVAAEQLKQQQP